MSKKRPSQRRPRTSLLLRLARGVKLLFTRDVRLERRGRTFHLVVDSENRTTPDDKGLITRPVAAPAPAPAASDAPSRMHGALRQLLAQHADARNLMRHLAFVERALRLSGPPALDGVPVEVLKKALVQLESLVTNWSSPGLAEMRSRLAMLVLAHDAAHKQFRPTNSNLSDFDTPERVEVSEATSADFEELERIWIEHAPDAAGAGRAVET
jgi:hypothetical protein